MIGTWQAYLPGRNLLEEALAIAPRADADTVTDGFRYGLKGKPKLPPELEGYIPEVAVAFTATPQVKIDGRNVLRPHLAKVVDSDPLARWLEGRGFDLSIHDVPFMRVTESALADPIAKRVYETGYHAAFPMVDPLGVVRNFKLRTPAEGRKVKSRALTGSAIRGLFLVNGDGLRFLRKPGEWVVLTEGEIDTAMIQSGPAVGTPGHSDYAALIDRIPLECDVVIATHRDEAGLRYQAAIAKELLRRGHSRVFEWTPKDRRHPDGKPFDLADAKKASGCHDILPRRTVDRDRLIAMAEGRAGPRFSEQYATDDLPF